MVYSGGKEAGINRTSNVQAEQLGKCAAADVIGRNRKSVIMIWEADDVTSQGPCLYKMASSPWRTMPRGMLESGLEFEELPTQSLSLQSVR